MMPTRFHKQRHALACFLVLLMAVVTVSADDKVYIGTRRGDFWVLATGKEKRVLSYIRLNAPVISTCVAANGTLYVGTMNRLYALRKADQVETAQ